MDQIPKIIHYCWFGNTEKPQLVNRCIESWKQYCPDYQIVEWNENNFNINENEFVKEAYEAKKWAFVSDYVRAQALLEYGGIYLDTDMQILQPLDRFLENTGFLGFEAKDTIAAGIIGCKKGHQVIKEFLEYYQDKHFMVNGERSIAPSPMIITQIMLDKGLMPNGKKQTVAGMTTYPQATFFPTDYRWVMNRYSSETFTLHHYMDSWGRNSNSNGRTITSRLRLSFVYLGRNILGTSTMFKLGKRIRKYKQ